MNIITIAGSVLFAGAIAGGCGSSQEAVNQETHGSAVRVSEEMGTTISSSASFYVQLAKEEVENAAKFSANGEGERAETMLLRAQADCGLAAALSRTNDDKTEAALVLARVRQIRQYNRLHQAMEKP